jgi:hypothetical protein
LRVTPRTARLWHGLTAAVAIAALVLQLVLVIRGGKVLDEVEPPDLGLRLARFVAYFTIQSNLLVAVLSVQLARDPLRNGNLWRVVRLAGVVGITVTGVVHFALLRPLLDLDGADWFADKLLHMVVPVLAVIGWALLGPRPRVEPGDVWRAISWPVAWVVVVLVVGGLSGWYPYPFMDHREEHGTAGVALAVAGIAAFFLLVCALVRYVDQHAQPAPQAWDPYRGGVTQP